MCDMSSNTMPYRSFHSQSRVEYIKKKFETSFLENNGGSVKQTNATHRNNVKLLEELKELNLNKKVVNSKTEHVENDESSKNEGKICVKRTPAFRGEKFGSTKSLTRLPRQQNSKSESFMKLKHESQNENAKEKILEAEFRNEKVRKEFKRSKTDSDLLKHCSEENSNREISNSNPLSLKNSSLLVVDENQESNKNADVNFLAQYSVVNKKKNNANQKESVHLSESIRRALQSPLPKGPPPKKPPRTFCHVSNKFIQPNSPNNITNSLSLTTTTITTTAAANTTSTATVSMTQKVDIPKLKSKLEKLEKAIKVHESGALINAQKKQFDKKMDLAPKKVETGSVQDTTNTDQSCLPISICLTQSPKIYNFKKLSKTKSEFYLDINKSNGLFDSGKIKEKSSAGLASSDVNIPSSEAIYDLPCLNKKNSFETFGKCSKYLKEAVNAKKAEDLHYMCTDVINQVGKYPNYFSNINQKKNIEEENRNLSLTKSYFHLDEEREKSCNMSNDVSVVKLREVCEALSESSDESDADSLSVKFTDSAKERHKGRSGEKNFTEAAAQRKIYVSRVSSKLMDQNPCWKYKNKNSYAHLFECCLVVGLTLCESKQNVPYIKSIFPPDTEPPPLIESLCFPDASYWPPNSENHQPGEQYYSLVVTKENGERKFGYCRRVLPEGGHICLPLTYCIISPHRAGGFFYKVLEELESKHGSPGVENFIKQLYESEFPGPGERLKLREILEEATKTSQINPDPYLSSTLIRRPPDVRLEEKDLTQLFQHLQLPVFLKIFSSLLHERKVLLLSNSLRNLSSCTEALQSVLLPFSWQHTCIPVLPTHLVEMCDAPTPYMMGLLKPRNVEKFLTNINFEDGILVDLDESKILKCCGDEASILPARLVRNLKTSLHLATNANDMLSESVRSVLISDAFIRFFVQVCGNYYKFIVKLSCGENIFQKENFIKSAESSNAKQAFLDWFTETAMFNSFIQDRLQGDHEDMVVKLFSRRAMEYSEESINDSALMLKNYKVINKKVRTFGDKIKDFTAFTK